VSSVEEREETRHEQRLPYEWYGGFVTHVLHQEERCLSRYQPSEQRRRRMIWLVRKICEEVGFESWPLLDLVVPVTDILVNYSSQFPDWYDQHDYDKSWTDFINGDKGLALSRFHPS
jgi:hypothetical protein